MGACESKYRTPTKIAFSTVKGSKEKPMNEDDKIIEIIMKKRESLDQKMFKSLKSAGSNRKEERYNL